jgi:GTPase
LNTRYNSLMLQTTTTLRFLLVSMFSRKKDRQVVESELEEAGALITTYGGQVVEINSQNDSHFNKGTYIGKGKITEISSIIEEKHIDVVCINDNLSTSQIYRLKTIFSEQSLHIQVWDRTDLILYIFKKHATTSEAKLQIKLADIHHQGPQLQGMGKQMSQQGAGIGTRGMGQTNTQIMKQHWQDEIKQIERELQKLTSSRTQQMEHRKKLRLPTISIVGYTNAGKSTLFNLLTKKKNLVRNAPFATLDSSIGKLYLHTLQKEAFVTDTIGFIQNLPTKLIQAFKSTLMETVNADLLLHVIDVSDPFFPEKIATVEQVLDSLGIASKNKIYVFNKIDSEKVVNKELMKTDLTNQYAHYHAQFISATQGLGFDQLISTIEQEIVSK